ncbi:MAG TPA: restriction endonuclease subunit S, partial [Flavobacterium sp.]|uniref:restriction endonuclease subunit S n=1 Tax=Flavobacterium sp. TaxID=239 RepID=UPI002ECFD6D5
MELVQKRYIQTEVGLIPSDWSLVKFKDVSFMKGRIGWQGLNQTEFTNNSEEPFLITGMNFKDGEIRWNEVYHVSNERYEIAKEIQLKINDVLMTKDGTIGKLLFVNDLPYPFKATLNSHLLVFRPLKKSYNPKYLYYNLASPYFNKHIELTKSGTTFFGVSQTSVGEYNLILPPIEEQTAIATALSDTDNWINRLEQLIAKKRLIKQGAMQELLRPKQGWENKKLGECAFITKLAGFEYSLHFNSYKDGGEIVVIRGTNITNNKLDLGDIKTIPEAISKKLPRSKLSKNDLVFAYVGTIGPIYLVEENDKFHLGPNTSKISVNKEINSKYVYHYFTSESIKKEIIEHTSIGAQPSLSMSKIRNFNIA